MLEGEILNKGIFSSPSNMTRIYKKKLFMYNFRERNAKLLRFNRKIW